MTEYSAEPIPLDQYQPSGPSPALFELHSRASQGPSIMYLPEAEADAFTARVMAARELSDLSAEDQALILKGNLEVDAGQSDTLVDPENWSHVDYAAQDALLEEAEDGAAGADTVVQGKSRPVDFDDDEWVGV